MLNIIDLESQFSKQKINKAKNFLYERLKKIKKQFHLFYR